jgi:hypothetical protein
LGLSVKQKGWFRAFQPALLGLTLEQWVEIHLQNHVFYEARKDRKNFYELLAAIIQPLA